MHKECIDCHMFLSPDTSICPVCGFDNTDDDDSDIALETDQLINTNNDFVSENYPGF